MVFIPSAVESYATVMANVPEDEVSSPKFFFVTMVSPEQSGFLCFTVMNLLAFPHFKQKYFFVSSKKFLFVLRLY